MTNFTKESQHHLFGEGEGQGRTGMGGQEKR